MCFCSRRNEKTNNNTMEGHAAEAGRYHRSNSTSATLLAKKRGRCNLGARTWSCHFWGSRRPGCPRVYLRMGRASLPTRSPHSAQTPGWWEIKLRLVPEIQWVSLNADHLIILADQKQIFLLYSFFIFLGLIFVMKYKLQIQIQNQLRRRI